MLSFSAGVFPDAIFTHSQRVGVLERFRRCVEAVGHVRVCGIHAIGVWPRAHATSDSLVIWKLTAGARIDATDSQVIHRSLASGGNPIRDRFSQSFEYGIDDSLGCLDVAAANGSGRTRIHHGTFRSNDLERAHAAGI